MRYFLIPFLSFGIGLPVVAQNRQNPGPPMPKGAEVHQDLAYIEGGHERQVLDLYIPEAGSGPWPLVVWVHGGGWQGGSKRQCLPLRLRFLERGFAVASLDYRLSGDAIFPAQIEDCKAAVRWLRAHAGEYNLDPDRFAAWGSSAGGHLVCLLGTTGDTDKFSVGEHLAVSSAVQAVADFYGPTDLAAFVQTPNYTGHARADSPESKLLGGPVLESLEAVRLANPITYVSREDPPFLIMHGTDDPVVPPQQSELLLAAFEEAGVPAIFKPIDGARHGGPQFTNPKIGDIVAEFFRQSFNYVPAKSEALPEDAPGK